MPYISFANKDISFKIVYCGPGMSGKTTNLVCIHKALAAERKGELLMLNTEQERTLFFDFFPVELGQVEGYAVHFNMYTVPGQVYYEASRRLVLDGADGIVFVADSQPDKVEENRESFSMLLDNLHSYGVDPKTFPMALQYNKRDCTNPIPLGDLEQYFSLNGIPVFESVAVNGQGVFETVRNITQQAVERFRI
jgi:signal recognition particle receptor subunit beta